METCLFLYGKPGNKLVQPVTFKWIKCHTIMCPKSTSTRFNMINSHIWKAPWTPRSGGACLLGFQPGSLSQLLQVATRPQSGRDHRLISYNPSWCNYTSTITSRWSIIPRKKLMGIAPCPMVKNSLLLIIETNPFGLFYRFIWFGELNCSWKSG